MDSVIDPVAVLDMTINIRYTIFSTIQCLRTKAALVMVQSCDFGGGPRHFFIKQLARFVAVRFFKVCCKFVFSLEKGRPDSYCRVTGLKLFYKRISLGKSIFWIDAYTNDPFSRS